MLRFAEELRNVSVWKTVALRIMTATLFWGDWSSRLATPKKPTIYVVLLAEVIWEPTLATTLAHSYFRCSVSWLNLDWLFLKEVVQMCFDDRIGWRDQDAYGLDMSNIFKKAPNLGEGSKKHRNIDPMINKLPLYFDPNQPRCWVTLHQYTPRVSTGEDSTLLAITLETLKEVAVGKGVL